MAMLTSAAMVLSWVEAQLPAFAAIPGVKVGLANAAVVFALYRFGWRSAAWISLVRVAAVSMLFGSAASLAYSVAGAVLSLLGMAALKVAGWFSHVAVSVTGGVLHNVGQVAMACILLETNALKYYLPFLIFSGVLAGLAVGTVSAALVRRVRI